MARKQPAAGGLQYDGNMTVAGHDSETDQVEGSSLKDQGDSFS
jgi:hypothetical protein